MRGEEEVKEMRVREEERTRGDGERKSDMRGEDDG